MTPTGPPVPTPFNTPPQEEVDQEHLRLLELGYLVAGLLEIVFASFFIGHIVIGILSITHKIPAPPRSGFPVPFGYFFLIGGSITVLGGWTLGTLTLIGRRFLRQRRHYTYLLVVAAVNCLIAPVGTALGVFAILLLTRPSIRALFPRVCYELLIHACLLGIFCCGTLLVLTWLTENLIPAMSPTKSGPLSDLT